MWLPEDAECRTLAYPEARSIIVANHYTGTFPSTWTRSYSYQGAIVVYALSANPWLEKYLFDEPVGLLELARLWAPDGHAPNLLTRAISRTLAELRRDVPKCEAIVAFADPVQSHHGGIYQAASWLYLGRSVNPLAYQALDGSVVARRRFHDRQGSYRPEGFVKVRAPAKYRYGKLLTRRARKLLRLQPEPYSKSTESTEVRVISCVPQGESLLGAQYDSRS